MVKILEYRWMEGGLGIIDVGDTATPANRHTTAAIRVVILYGPVQAHGGGRQRVNLAGKRCNLQHTAHPSSDCPRFHDETDCSADVGSTLVSSIGRIQEYRTKVASRDEDTRWSE